MEAITAIDRPIAHQCMDLHRFERFKESNRTPICESTDGEFVEVDFESAPAMAAVSKYFDEPVDPGCQVFELGEWVVEVMDDKACTSRCLDFGFVDGSGYCSVFL